ncbi:MAG: SBBP repeat-containing protein [Planctomycetota bacterium]|jgi:hypothetical protein
MNTHWKVIVVVGLLALTPGAWAEDPYPVAWQRQIGTAEEDESRSVAVDSAGHVFISGSTAGSLGGPNAGSNDAFLAKYAPTGDLLWTRQTGTSTSDFSYSVAVDSAGNAFITGWTLGDLGGVSAGGRDAFLSKYDPSGTLLWTEQLGTTEYDEGLSVAIDGMGNAFIAGWTLGALEGPSAGSFDVFVSKYDPSGTQQWTRQLGTAEADYGNAVAIDGVGNVYVGGETQGDLAGVGAGGADAFVAKYDSAGSLLWTRQLGTASADWGAGVAVDGAGNVYVSGGTQGDLGGANAGGGDAFLAKYDSSGSLLWTQQLGTDDGDCSFSVAVSNVGDAFITGYTYGNLSETNLGKKDVFLAKYGSTGDLVWVDQLGTTTWDASYAVAIDSDCVLISGRTQGALGGPSAGYYDAFLVKYVPEPATLGLLALGGLAPLRRKR